MGHDSRNNIIINLELSIRTSVAGHAAITRREGEKAVCIQDSVGISTIGVGHTSAAGAPEVKANMKITAAQSDEILGRDLEAVENDVNEAVKVPLNQNQFDALSSLHFAAYQPVLDAHSRSAIGSLKRYS